MRDYEYRDIHEMGNPRSFMDGKAHPNFGYELRLLAETNKTLLGNFNKVSKWIKTNCPHLSGVFKCRHNVYHWTALVVEDGKSYLEEGGHGYGFSTALSADETAVCSRGSTQGKPYAFEGVQFFPNSRLEEFLKQWPEIKQQIIIENKEQSGVYSEDFEA